MKSYTKYLNIKTKEEKEILNITYDVEKVLHESGIKEGLLLVNSMHITSSVFINDEENGLKKDFLEWLEKLAPEKSTYDGYYHHRTGEINADAHLKRTIMGREVVVAITKGSLDFGPWEQIFYGEFDGRRDKKVLIKIIGE
ncbi:MAG: secondary thiamine-phosphate synthase enzyme YjbQ [Candidatus Nanoarchaeia archaeon]|nr:secondary thiamine-phosphate synthase enzyme YjbQ [Candidatus Nanoarchaeia archaeon]